MEGYVVNPKRNISAVTMAKILNGCKMLFSFDIEERRGKQILYLKTDKVVMEYMETKKDGMLKFLKILKEMVINKRDVEELIEDLRMDNDDC